MMVRLCVRVTRADIGAGVKNDCQRCPVALALGRATGLDWDADLEWLRPKGTAFQERVATPDSVRRWMNDFDFCAHRGRLRPCTFCVDVPLRTLLGASLRG